MLAVADELMSRFAATLTTFMIAIRSRSGALEALADGPATSGELADRAGLSERHVGERLAGRLNVVYIATP
jgi:hypothetical protein